MSNASLHLLSEIFQESFGMLSYNCSSALVDLFGLKLIWFVLSLFSSAFCILQGVRKKVLFLIEFLLGITLKIQLKGVLFSGHPVFRIRRLTVFATIEDRLLPVVIYTKVTFFRQCDGSVCPYRANCCGLFLVKRSLANSRISSNPHFLRTSGGIMSVVSRYFSFCEVFLYIVVFLHCESARWYI